MAQRKCGDCRFCVRHGLETFCTYKRQQRKRDDLIFVNQSACNAFSSADFHCVDCKYYNRYNVYCDKHGSYVERMQSVCEDFFRRGDNGPNKSSDCFLTSACVEYMGKSDDCAELMALRSFRDGYLKSRDDGKLLITEYYDIAPKIVETIKSSNKKEEYFNYIYSVICKCVKLIKEDKNEETLLEYVSMVKKLKSEVIYGAL